MVLYSNYSRWFFSPPSYSQGKEQAAVAKSASATTYPRGSRLTKASQVVPKRGFPPFVDHCHGKGSPQSPKRAQLWAVLCQQ